MGNLIKRLRACEIECCGEHAVGLGPSINPDGPEAADLIEQLQAKIAELEASPWRYPPDMPGAGVDSIRIYEDSDSGTRFRSTGFYSPTEYEGDTLICWLSIPIPEPQEATNG